MFQDCNLTNTLWGGTTLNDVSFENCKLLGSNLSVCNPFMLSVRFRESNLTLTQFAGLDLKGTIFENCILHQTEFTTTNLTQASFLKSDLKKAIFENTILLKADFTTAYNYTIDPAQNRMKGARFSTAGLAGLLTLHGIIIE